MEARGLEAKEVILASKKLGRSDAEDLVRSATKIIACKGKAISEHAGGGVSEEIVTAMLGPTGNLRAPTVRSGKTVLSGFNEEAWAKVFD